MAKFFCGIWKRLIFFIFSLHSELDFSDEKEFIAEEIKEYIQNYHSERQLSHELLLELSRYNIKFSYYIDDCGKSLPQVDLGGEYHSTLKSIMKSLTTSKAGSSNRAIFRFFDRHPKVVRKMDFLDPEQKYHDIIALTKLHLSICDSLLKRVKPHLNSQDMITRINGIRHKKLRILAILDTEEELTEEQERICFVDYGFLVPHGLEDIFNLTLLD